MKPGLLKDPSSVSRAARAKVIIGKRARNYCGGWGRRRDAKANRFHVNRRFRIFEKLRLPQGCYPSDPVSSRALSSSASATTPFSLALGGTMSGGSTPGSPVSDRVNRSPVLRPVSVLHINISESDWPAWLPCPPPLGKAIRAPIQIDCAKSQSRFAANWSGALLRRPQPSAVCVLLVGVYFSGSSQVSGGVASL